MIADQDDLWRGMAARAIALHPQLRLSGSFASPDALWTAMQARSPDVLLVAEAVPGVHGAELAARIRSAGLPARMVVVYDVRGVEAVTRAIARGARGCVARDARSEVLCAALLDVAAGGFAFTCTP
jgi:DNA-binding NarL/FixJ family response regulator